MGAFHLPNLTGQSVKKMCRFKGMVLQNLEKYSQFQMLLVHSLYEFDGLAGQFRQIESAPYYGVFTCASKPPFKRCLNKQIGGFHLTHRHASEKIKSSTIQ